MRKSDFELIAEQYSSHILNEMVPPFVAGTDTGDYGTEDVGAKGKFKAVHAPQYAAAFKWLRRWLSEDPNIEDTLRLLCMGVSKDLAEIIADAGGRIEDERPQMQKRIADMLNDTFKNDEGIPIFGSQAIHVARNILDALERTGSVKEVDKTRKSSSGEKSEGPSGFNLGKYGR